MKAVLEKREGHTAYLSVEVEPEEVRRALDHAYRHIAREISIPGFRPGRAPRGLIERRVGRQAVVEHALDELLPRAYAQAVEITGIEPIDRPRIEDVGEVDDDRPLSFRAVVAVKPEVELPDYRSIRMPLEVEEVKPEHVDQVVEELRQGHAQLVAVEDPDHTVAAGDFVVMDFVGESDGEPIPGGRGEGVLAEVGGGRLRPEFEENLVGMRAGETRSFDVRFADDDANENLRGRTVRFTVTVREIKRKELPAVDDDFAATVGYASLEELRRDVQNRLEQRARLEAVRQLAERAVAAVVDGARVELPEILVQRRLESMLDELRRRLEAQGASLESYLETEGKTLEALREELRPAAELGVKRELVLSAVARREGIQATEDDLAREVQALAARYGRPAGEVRRLLGHPEVRRELAEEIVQRKTARFLAELVQEATHAESDQAAGGAANPEAAETAVAADADQPPAAPSASEGEIPR